VTASSPGVAIADGAGTAVTGTVVFSNSNGVTFGLSASTMTASVAPSAITAGFGWLGDGSDGPAVFDGTTPVAGCTLSASTYTATRQLFPSTATFSNGVVLEAAGYRMVCNSTLIGPGSGAATIRNNGVAGAGSVAGAGATAGFYGGGTAGGQGSTSTGNDATNGSFAPAAYMPGKGGAGGANGNAGGAGGNQNPQPASVGDLNDIWPAISGRLEKNVSQSVQGGTGGGGGAGGTINGGIGGGGGGGGGYNCVIARTTTNPANISIEAKGGAGGNAVAGGTGTPAGGGGGGGGYVIHIIAFGTLCSVSAAGGAAGAGNNGGVAGNAGGNGKTYTQILSA